MGCRIYKHLPVLGSILLISFLSLSSQWLFRSLEPGPLPLRQSIFFNLLVASQVICYARSCLANPGVISKTALDVDYNNSLPSRWCTKCINVKPPRSHHCRECSKCVPKMDHHCIWIANCVSFRVFPHFFRFLFYSVLASAYLESCIFVRLGVLWAKRHLPSYLGPNVWQLVHLVVVTLLNSVCLFAISILFVRSAWSLAWNITTIESWEIERHQALLRRARASGGRLPGPGGAMVEIEKHEFPYDIGIWRNFVQGMGNGNFFSWVFPFSSSLSVYGGTLFETNGFDNPSKAWPPPDPDRIPHFAVNRWNSLAHNTPDYSQQSEIDDFRKRQSLDLSRKRKIAGDPVLGSNLPVGQKPFLQNHLVQLNGNQETTPVALSSKDANKGWRNADGECLHDFGVDEETEIIDENIPLAELMGKGQY